MRTTKLNFSRFARARAGSIAPLFAMSFFLVIGAVGLSIDSARGYGAKSHLQNAVDAATLATARRLAVEPLVDVTGVFTTFFNLSKSTGDDVRIGNVAVRKTTNTIEADVDAQLPTLFMQLFGTSSMTVAASAIAEFGIGDVELVLALDNTASMAGTKIATLKTAAKRLVSSLSSNAQSPDKLRIGVVPFAKYVNVGIGNRNASWLDVPADWSETVRNCGDTYPNATYTNCRTINSTCTTDGIPGPCSWQQCDVNYGPPVYQCTSTVVNHTWNGCVRARVSPLDVTDGSYSTRVPGQMDETCSQPITPLTTDQSSVRNDIDRMAPIGDTYIPEGLMWGWRALSPLAPFGESRSGGNANVSRYLVLMTDGVNSVSPTPTGHDGTDTATANANTQQACSAIKGDNITIFTVAFEVNDNAIKDILRACASSGGFFYDAADSSQLITAFDAIGQQLVNLKITH